VYLFSDFDIQWYLLNIYFVTHQRASPYIVGLALGYVFYRLNTTKVKLSKVIIATPIVCFQGQIYSRFSLLLGDSGCWLGTVFRHLVRSGFRRLRPRSIQPPLRPSGSCSLRRSAQNRVGLFGGMADFCLQCRLWW